MLKTSFSLCNHGNFWRIHLSQLPLSVKILCRSFAVGPNQAPVGQTVDVTPGSEDHWKNDNYPKESLALQKFLKKAKDDFNENNKDNIVSDADISAVFNEWYLRKLECNKWNHFLNEMISTRFTTPYDWDKSDPIPDWLALHNYPTDPTQSWSPRPTQSGRGIWNENKHLRELTAEGNTSIGDFEVDYTRSLSSKFVSDTKPPYLETQLKNLNAPSTGFDNLSGSLPEFFTSNISVKNEYQLDNEEMVYIPPNYYNPHVPLPAYRNHEALITADPRNPKYVPQGTVLEDEPAMMLKQGIKQHKRVQDKVGMAYTPDYDHELWSSDMNRPFHITSTYGFTPKPFKKTAVVQRKQLHQRRRSHKKSFVPTWDNLIEFNWKSRMTRHQYLPSKSPTFHVIKIAGNGRGCAGMGIGRASSYMEAAKKAEYSAQANMIYLPRYMNHTIAHTLYGKFHRLRCYIVPKPIGYGERGPPIVKAICHAFGVRDFAARFEGKQRIANFSKIRAVWAAFFRATNPQQDCEDRGQKLVEVYPETDGSSYQLQRGWSHDMIQKGRMELEKHQNAYEGVEGFKQYDLSEKDKLSLPLWIVDEPANYWEGGLPDINDYKWRPDLIDILNQKGSAGITPQKEAQIQRLLAEKVDPCDHHFRWMKAMIRVAPKQGLGM